MYKMTTNLTEPKVACSISAAIMCIVIFSEFYDLVECVKNNDRDFQPNFQRCLTENLAQIMNFMQAPYENPLAGQDSVLCG